MNRQAAAGTQKFRMDASFTSFAQAGRYGPWTSSRGRQMDLLFVGTLTQERAVVADGVEATLSAEAAGIDRWGTCRTQATSPVAPGPATLARADGATATVRVDRVTTNDAEGRVIRFTIVADFSELPSAASRQRSVRSAARRAAFLALMAAQDRGTSVRVSRAEIARRFGLTLSQVEAVEREGLANQWPPL